jgi:hypothetical protein
MLRVVLGLVIAVATPLSSWSAFFTYSQWDALDGDLRAVYIAGAFDSLVGYSDPSDTSAEIHYFRCIQRSKMDNRRLADNVRAYAATRPDIQQTVQ